MPDAQEGHAHDRDRSELARARRAGTPGPLVSARIEPRTRAAATKRKPLADHRRHRLDDDGDAEVGRAPDQPQRDERAPDAEPGDPQPTACLGARHGAHCAIPARKARHSASRPVRAWVTSIRANSGPKSRLIRTHAAQIAPCARRRIRPSKQGLRPRHHTSASRQPTTKDSDHGCAPTLPVAVRHHDRLPLPVRPADPRHGLAGGGLPDGLVPDGQRQVPPAHASSSGSSS